MRFVTRFGARGALDHVPRASTITTCPRAGLLACAAALALLTACAAKEPVGIRGGGAIAAAGSAAGVGPAAGTFASGAGVAGVGITAGTGAAPDAGPLLGVAGGGAAGAAGSPVVAGAGGSLDAGSPLDADVDTGAPPPSDPLDALRQKCVDTINTYRATLGLAPLSRAPASEEACSDQGAKLDHDTKKPHGSAAQGALGCRSYGVAQNTCPDHPYGGARGSQQDVLVKCLAGMWAEGEPPEGTDQCISDYFAGNTACFLAHGHYINMASATSKTVSCGFYDDGSVIWANQDFR